MARQLTDAEIRQRMEEIVVEHLALDAPPADNTTWDDMQADSLDTVELVMAFEQEWDIEISDEQAESYENFGAAVRGVIAIVRGRD